MRSDRRASRGGKRVQKSRAKREKDVSIRKRGLVATIPQDSQLDYGLIEKFIFVFVIFTKIGRRNLIFASRAQLARMPGQTTLHFEKRRDVATAKPRSVCGASFLLFANIFRSNPGIGMLLSMRSGGCKKKPQNHYE